MADCGEEFELDLEEAPAVPKAKAGGKRKAKAGAGPKRRSAPPETPERPSGSEGGGGPKGSGRKVCPICQNPSQQVLAKHPWCKECKCDIEGLKADSVKNGWSARYEEVRAAGGEVFRKLVRDYPSGGRGKARASYKLARLESIEAFSKKHQTGSAGKLVDWFDFQAYFKKKLLPTEDRQISK